MKTTPIVLPSGAAADPLAPADTAARPARPGRADALPPGTVIDGCEIVRVAADSGFAIVYLAREPGTKRRFAIKEYLPISLALRSADGRSVALRAPEHAEAFERGLLAFSAEARLLELRTHPALLRVLRSGRGQGTAYRVMPWLDGDTLLALRRGLPEPPEEAALKRLLFGLLGALQTLHDAGEVHGAVSPGNIMVLADDRAMLLDTDAVARALVGDQTRALMAMVSPGFAPQGPVAAEPGVTGAPGDPRAAAGVAAGVAADLHALAAVAHFCISGALPAAGERHAPLAGVVRGLRLRLARPAYSASLLAAIDAALSADIAQRPTSVAEFRAALSGQAEPARATAAPAAGSPAAPSEDGPAWVPGAAAPASAPNYSPTPAPARATGYRTRQPGTQRRHAQRLAWWGGGALLALTLATVSLVVVKERAAIALRADGFTAPAPPDLAPPSALPARAAAGRVAPPVEPAASAALAVVPPVVVPHEKPARAVAAAARPNPERATAAKLAKAAKAEPDAPSKPIKAPTPEKPQSPAARGAERVATSPRAECGARTEFALYRCMKTECQLPRWSKHAQCQRLRETDSVD